jgi:DNA-binding MarR family transcriptional regulator
MQPTNDISFRIQHIASLLLKESDQVLQEQLGIGMSQLRILRIMQNNESLLQRQIAMMLDQTEASISRQVKLLHQKQLLATVVNPKDRREHITNITPKGMRVIEAALAGVESFQAQYLEGISDKQQAELLELLERIEQHAALTNK